MTQLYICDGGWDQPNGQNDPTHSFREVDIFAFIPSIWEEESFSLSLRKNLETSEWELYSWHRADDDSTKKVVAHTTDFKLILKQATDLWHYYWDPIYAPISDFTLKPCEHKYNHKDILCDADWELD
jgi:hypothetical protein